MESDVIPYLTDANVYIGFMDEYDPLHQQANQTISSIKQRGGTFILLDHVIQEVLTILLYTGRNHTVESFLSMTQNHSDIIAVESPLLWFQEAIDLAKKNAFKPKISLTDWLLLSRSLVTGVPILTFDKQLLAASKKLC